MEEIRNKLPPAGLEEPGDRDYPGQFLSTTLFISLYFFESDFESVGPEGRIAGAFG